MIIQILAESTNFELQAQYEDIVLVRKSDEIEFDLGSHYGDAKVGLISPDENWFITAGEGLLYFDFNHGLKHFLRSGFSNKSGVAFVHDAKYESELGVKILLDPWSDYASTWLLKLPELELSKLSNSPSLVNEPYREKVAF